jgi:predicted DNA-binding antitoxin AbrB/MazE fold protein
MLSRVSQITGAVMLNGGEKVRVNVEALFDLAGHWSLMLNEGEKVRVNVDALFDLAGYLICNAQRRREGDSKC